MSRRKKNKRKARILIAFVFIIALVVLYFLIFKVIKPAAEKPKHLDTIEGYNYTIDSRDTKLMKDTFASLKEVLTSESIDEEKYAEYLSELFVIDLYTINNKNSKYDIGGEEYVYPDHKSTYKSKVEGTIYRYVEEKSNRKQKLPEVSSVKVSNINKEGYKYQDKDYDGYTLDITWDYLFDMGYDKKATIKLMKNDKFLYIVEFTPTTEEVTNNE